MKNIIRKEIPMGSKTLVLETGKIARQATASVIASMGGTVVMCAVVTKQSEVGRDFFPLSVHYMEKPIQLEKYQEVISKEKEDQLKLRLLLLD